MRVGLWKLHYISTAHLLSMEQVMDLSWQGPCSPWGQLRHCDANLLTSTLLEGGVGVLRKRSQVSQRLRGG